MNRVCVFILGFFLVAAAIAAPSSPVKKTYNGYVVIRAIPSSALQVSVLKTLEHDPKVQFWKEVGEVSHPVDLMVSEDHKQYINDLLQTANIQSSVFIEDVQKLIDENDVIEQRNRQLHDSQSKSINLQVYHSYTEIMTWLDELATTYPSLCSLETIGHTNENRALKVIKIGTDSSKPIIWIDAGIHAREWISPATIIYFISQLVEGYSSDAEVKQLVDNVNWYIMPMHNPDGYEYSRSNERMWRKNRIDTGQSSIFWGRCIGTDLNRNWDHYWMHTGASQNGCSDIYAGSHAFSELETTAVKNFVNQHKANIRSFLTFHSYSQLWMTPWGYTSSLPSDFNELKALGEAAVSALRQVHNTRYGAVTSSTLALYAAAGGSDDWAKAVAGIKWSYTIELRDTGRYGFLAPASEILPSGEETWAAVKVVGKHIMNGN